MKKCYANKELHISDKDFEKPAYVSIRLDCDKETDPKLDKTNPDDSNPAEF
jgi:penicillin-binding protein 1A